MGCKAVETTCSINSALGPGTVIDHTVQLWFKKFCKRHESFEDEEHSGWPSEVDNNNWKPSLRLILLKLQEKLPKNSTSTTLWSFCIWKKLISGCLVNWAEILKIIFLKGWSSLILRINSKPFLDWIVTCNKKWIAYNNQWQPPQWLDREEALKHFLKPTLHQKKVMVTVWWSAAHLNHYTFLNFSKTVTSEEYAQQTNEMHWKPTPSASFGQHKAPSSSPQQCLTTLHTTSASKDEKIGFYLSLQSFISSAAFTWPLANQSATTVTNLSSTIWPLANQSPTLTTSSSISATFLEGKYFHNQQNAENAF